MSAVNHVVTYSINPPWPIGAFRKHLSVILAISMEKLQARLQEASTEYQKLQSDLSVAVDSRQRLDAQLQENEMVKKVWAEIHRRRTGGS